MVRTAFGQFKDLQDAAAAEAEVEDLVKRLGLPLLVRRTNCCHERSTNQRSNAARSTATPSHPPTLDVRL